MYLTNFGQLGQSTSCIGMFRHDNLRRSRFKFFLISISVYKKSNEYFLRFKQSVNGAVWLHGSIPAYHILTRNF